MGAGTETRDETMTTTTTNANRPFFISNMAGGDRRRFRFVNGEISVAAIRYADRLERVRFGGADFSDSDACAQYQQICEDRDEAEFGRCH